MKKCITALISGLLFALGLGISGMTKPTFVIGFLNIVDHWNPTLGFVMGGAIAVYAPLYYLIRKRLKPAFADKFFVPEKNTVDSRLVVGAVLFGLGWGLGGYCPGPAIASVGTLAPQVLTFLIAMTIGMLIFKTFVGSKEQAGG